MNIKHKKPCFKSAVAFFFLFFLHGFSIGNGQQGITHNVPQLCAALCCACGKVEYRCCYALMRIINEKLK